MTAAVLVVAKKIQSYVAGDGASQRPKEAGLSKEIRMMSIQRRNMPRALKSSFINTILKHLHLKQVS